MDQQQRAREILAKEFEAVRPTSPFNYMPSLLRDPAWKPHGVWVNVLDAICVAMQPEGTSNADH